MILRAVSHTTGRRHFRCWDTDSRQWAVRLAASRSRICLLIRSMPLKIPAQLQISERQDGLRQSAPGFS